MDKFFSRIKIKNILYFVITVFVLIQLYRPNKNEYQSVESDDFLRINKAPLHIESAIKKACYDCHSNSTNYEWFDNIAPISWYVDKRIEKGKFSLNFSIWNNYETWQKLTFLNAIEFDIKTDKMPPENYVQFHPEAKLSEMEKQHILNWILKVDRKKIVQKENNHNNRPKE